MLVWKEAFRPQPVSGHHPGGEHHSEGHRCPVPQQAHRVGRGQEIHPKMSVLPQGRADGRADNVRGDLSLASCIQGCYQEGAAAAAATEPTVTVGDIPAASRGHFLLSANVSQRDERQLGLWGHSTFYSDHYEE